MPSKTCRHVKALSKKNWILWRRSIACSIFELVLPVLLMCLLAWMRSKVKIKQTDLT